MSTSLSFTGERFLPECGGEIRYEHWHRYALVRHLGRQAAVLDAASGEGYGSAMLAGSATSVVGVDLSAEAVRHARARYGYLANLQFITASCDSLPLQSASFDLAISFETIEHIGTQQEFVAELARVLRPDGVLVMSSPNKRIYTEAHDYHNEFHVRELYREELEQLLRPVFPHIQWFGQKLLFHSAIWPENQEVAAVECLTDDGSRITATSRPAVEPMYYLAVCSRNPAALPATLARLSLFDDAGESVYQDYVNQTRRVIELDRLLINREQLVAERDEILTLRTQQMEERERLIAERDALLVLRTGQLDECAGRIAAQEKQLEAQGREIDTRDGQIKAQARLIATLEHRMAEYTSFTWWLKLPLLLVMRAFKAKD